SSAHRPLHSFPTRRSSDLIAALLDYQFGERGPLLRTTALSGLPPQVRSTMIDRSNRIARRFAGMLSDGIAQGSIRAIDPLVASRSEEHTSELQSRRDLVCR